MGRYWKIITIFIVTILIISTHYVGLAAKDSLEITFEKVSGSQEEADKVLIYADYGEGILYEGLLISSKETISLSEQSVIVRGLRRTIDPVTNKLMKEHKDFMRGKALFSQRFYEDNELVVYASIKRVNAYRPKDKFSFDVVALNKKTDKTSKIHVDLPIKNYGWLDVADVQVANGYVKVFVSGALTDGRNELSVYTFDLESQKLVKNEPFFSSTAVTSGWAETRIINDYYSIQPEKYLIIKNEVYANKVEGQGGEIQHPDAGPELTTNEVFIYNTENNQLKEISIPEDLIGSIDLATIIDSTIYIPQNSLEQGMYVIAYDFEKEKLGKQPSFDFQERKKGQEVLFTKLTKGKIIQIYSEKNSYFLFIGDLSTGKTVYEGKLRVKYPKGKQKSQPFTVQEIQYVH